MRQGTDGRRSDLDWMRLALVLAVVPLGCARALGLAQGPASGAAGLAAAAQKAVQWIMPLFFMVSAGSARHALDRLWTRGFLVARVLRLFVPLVVAALVLGTCSAVGIASTALVEESLGWFPWYLVGLFVFSFLLPPLRFALRLPRARRFLSGLAAAATVPGVLQLAGALPAAAAVVPVLPGTPKILAAGGWGVSFYALVFLASFLLHGEQRLIERAARQRGWSVLFGALFLAGAAAARRAPAVPEAATAAMRAMASWSLTLAFLGFAARRLSAARAVPRVLTEASLPFSVLAQPVAGLLAAAAAAWQAPVGLKLALLFAATFLAVAALYAAVRRVTVLRFCFGLTPLPADTQGGSS